MKIFIACDVLFSRSRGALSRNCLAVDKVPRPRGAIGHMSEKRTLAALKEHVYREVHEQFEGEKFFSKP